MITQKRAWMHKIWLETIFFPFCIIKIMCNRVKCFHMLLCSIYIYIFCSKLKLKQLTTRIKLKNQNSLSVYFHILLRSIDIYFRLKQLWNKDETQEPKARWAWIVSFFLFVHVLQRLGVIVLKTFISFRTWFIYCRSKLKLKQLTTRIKLKNLKFIEPALSSFFLFAFHVLSCSIYNYIFVLN